MEAKTYPPPLRKSGTLDSNFEFEESTPVIGREYSTINIVDDLLNAENAEERIHDCYGLQMKTTVSPRVSFSPLFYSSRCFLSPSLPTCNARCISSSSSLSLPLPYARSRSCLRFSD